MNVFDETLQRSMPSVMVPTREPVERLTAFGERLLIAKNGVFIEIYRPWIRLVRQIAAFFVHTAIPYGEMAESTELLCGKVPATAIGEFVSLARAALPNETAGWIIWNQASREFRFAPAQLIEHSPSSLQYERPVLESSEMLVVDCHSHGSDVAFFSPTDDEDDAHCMKFALVVGNCNRSVPSLRLRLCAKGIIEDFDAVPSAWKDAALCGGVQ